MIVLEESGWIQELTMSLVGVLLTVRVLEVPHPKSRPATREARPAAPRTNIIKNNLAALNIKLMMNFTAFSFVFVQRQRSLLEYPFLVLLPLLNLGSGLHI